MLFWFERINKFSKIYIEFNLTLNNYLYSASYTENPRNYLDFPALKTSHPKDLIEYFSS